MPSRVIGALLVLLAAGTIVAPAWALCDAQLEGGGSATFGFSLVLGRMQLACSGPGDCEAACQVNFLVRNDPALDHLRALAIMAGLAAISAAATSLARPGRLGALAGLICAIASFLVCQVYFGLADFDRLEAWCERDEVCKRSWNAYSTGRPGQPGAAETFFPLGPAYWGMLSLGVLGIGYAMLLAQLSIYRRDSEDHPTALHEPWK